MQLHSLPPTVSTSFRNSEDDHLTAASFQTPATDPISSHTALPQASRGHRRQKSTHPSARLADTIEEPAYPAKVRLVILTVALIVAVFIIGLDTCIVGEQRHSLTSPIGAIHALPIRSVLTDARDRDSENHYPLSQLERCRLVWFGILTDPTFFSIDLR